MMRPPLMRPSVVGPSLPDGVYCGVDLSGGPAQTRHQDGNNGDAVTLARWRLVMASILFSLAFLAVFARMVDLMVIGQLAPQAPVPAVTTPPQEQGISGARADILDRNGVLVAMNLPTVNLYADATEVFEAEETAEQLHRIFPNEPIDTLFDKLSSNHRFVYLRRNLTPSEQASVIRMGVPGLDFENAQRRIYPQGPLLAHLVGTTDPDNVGLAGMELTLNDQLADTDLPVRLSVDVRIQQIVREELADAIGRFSATGGTAIVLDAHTGEIIALSSLPDFHPAQMGAAPEDARFNRATLGTYEMGSVFKLFTAAMALEEGTAVLDSRYDASRPLRIAKFTINDFHAKERWLSVPEVLVYSSNIGSAQMALEAGTRAQQNFLTGLGLLSPLLVEIPETTAPLYPTRWREINTVTISYGHGISVTPLHVTEAVAALVNGGIHRPATMLAGVPEATFDADQPPALSARTSDQMRALMRLIVTAGSGKQADVPGYRVGGKTGSAEVVSAQGGYDEDRLRTSFVAAFPMDAPEYVVLTMLEEPKGTRDTFNFATAGWNAAPTTGRMIARMAPLLGVMPKNDFVVDRQMPRMAQARAQMVSLQAEHAFSQARPGGGHEAD